jgi:hypothetical protein
VLLVDEANLLHEEKWQTGIPDTIVRFLELEYCWLKNGAALFMKLCKNEEDDCSETRIKGMKTFEMAAAHKVSQFTLHSLIALYLKSIIVSSYHCMYHQVTRKHRPKHGLAAAYV